eukprot:46531_1
MDKKSMESWINSRNYSTSAKAWFSGDIVRIFEDSYGEWLEVKYAINNTFQLKQTPRVDEKSVRPFSKAIKIYQYIYKAIKPLRSDPKFNKNVNSVAGKQNNILKELPQFNTVVNTLENTIKHQKDETMNEIICDTDKNVEMVKQKQNNILDNLGVIYDNNENKKDEIIFDEIMGDTVENVDMVAH